MEIKLQFLGASRTVTGSKYLLTYNKRHYLIDCGLFQGLKMLRLRNWRPLPINPSHLEAVILTHAHLDHSGYLPLLIKQGFKGKVFATRATRSLCGILLPDSGYLQEEDARFANKHHFSKHSPALPLYTEDEARQSLRAIEGVDWRHTIPVSKDVSVTFFPAGHILGSAIVQLNVGQRVIVFSGDLGRQKQSIFFPPEVIPKADYLIVESTYGNLTHPTEDPKESILKVIQETIKRGGIVIIPAFAVGRVQQILFILNELKKAGKLDSIPVYVNSPMAKEGMLVFNAFPKEQRLTAEQCRELNQVAQFISSVEESKKLNERKTPAIIISASGMLEGGRVLHHLKFLGPDPRNTILLIGFQAPGTRGELLMNGKKELHIHGELVPIRAEVKMIDTLSAHADQQEIVTWLSSFSRPPRITFVTHGESDSSEALRKIIEEKLFWHCQIPDYLETYWLE